jgi:hypothetical protein
MLVAEEAQLNQAVQEVQEVQVEVDRQQVIRELVVMQRFMEAEEVQAELVHVDSLLFGVVLDMEEMVVSVLSQTLQD